MNQNSLLVNSIMFMDKVVFNMSKVNWQGRTTCDPWTLKELLNHVTYEWLWAPELFAGKTVKEVGDKYEGDVLGNDPLGNYKKAVDKFLEVAKKVGPHTTVHLSYADVPASEYMLQLTVEALIHGWDLAVSSGQSGELPAAEVADLYKVVLKHSEEMAGTGMYGNQLSVDEDADDQTKLLAMLGRESNPKL